MSVSSQKKGTWVLNDTFKRLSSSCWKYAATDSTQRFLYHIGRGLEGQMGNNRTDIDGVGFPQELPGSDWSTICYNDSYRALVAKKTDGSFWAVGKNDYGKFGIGDGNNRSSPIQIDGCWCMIYAGHETSAGIKCDGTLWTWGYGNHGQRGLSTTTCNYTNETCGVPCQVGVSTSWRYVTIGQDAHAIKCDGTLWSWGYNGHGEAGNSTTCCYSSPIQIPGTWCEIRYGYPVIARRSDNTYWAWGHNNHGQLGDNTTANKSSPIQIPGCWCLMNANSFSQFVVGIKTDNSLWAWGRNDYGQLGLNDTIPRSSPVQIQGCWKYASTGHYHAVAVKTDGTLWAWGYNSGEQRYHCSSIIYSSPIQLPGTNWVETSADYEGTYMIKSTRLCDDFV